VTAPLNEPSYQNARRNWLLRYLGIQEKYDSVIATALLDAADDAAKSIHARVNDDAIGASVRRHQLQLAKRETHRIIDVLFRGLGNAIREGQSAAAVGATEAGFRDDEKVLDRLFGSDKARRGVYEDGLRQAASRGVQAMMTRILESNLTLSKRVYRTQALSNGWVDRIINSSLANGDSAADIARKVRSSIDPNVAGGVSYAAMRLGRTEINNAYHAQAINDMKEKPWVDHVKWNLSKVHEPQGCRCETYSRISAFPKESIPNKPHPQCMCYITPVLMDWGSFESNLIDRHFGDYIDRKR
jgi:hypothetical protein